MRRSLPLGMLALTLVVALSACGSTRTVTVTVTRTVTAPTSPAGVVVPSVVGLREPLAVQKTVGVGLRVRVFRRPRRLVPKGTVYEQSPPGGPNVSPGSTVTLFVSTGAH